MQLLSLSQFRFQICNFSGIALQLVLLVSQQRLVLPEPLDLRGQIFYLFFKQKPVLHVFIPNFSKLAVFLLQYELTLVQLLLNLRLLVSHFLSL